MRTERTEDQKYLANLVDVLITGHNLMLRLQKLARVRKISLETLYRMFWIKIRWATARMRMETAGRVCTASPVSGHNVYAILHHDDPGEVTLSKMASIAFLHELHRLVHLDCHKKSDETWMPFELYKKMQFNLLTDDEWTAELEVLIKRTGW